jgi:hypothetical protein
VLNTSVMGLHYVLIVASYNKILFLLYLFKLMHQHLYVSSETLCMVRLDDYIILQLKHLVGSKLGGMHDSIIWRKLLQVFTDVNI